MDYENKYKEALKRARIWKEKSGMPKDKQGILDNIFPELVESEDERIRKELITFLEELSKLGENTNFDKWKISDCANWIVWLEKQDKQKSWSKEDEENMEKILDAIGSYYYLTTDDDVLCDWLKSLKQRIKE